MTNNNRKNKDHRPATLDRRGFISAGVGAAAFTIIQPHLVRGSQANSKIELGQIGCGNRGGWISNLFMENGGYQIVTACDYFQDRVDAFGDRFKVDSARRFTGLAGHQKMLQSKPDAVVIESPPYFHAEHALAAVEAGCHVYQAKPLAVDVPGCRTFLAAGKKARQNKVCFLIDFQTRADARYQEAVARVHQGDVGRLVNGEAVYYAGPTWKRHIKDLKQDPSDPELQLRGWGVNRILSGDIITEQNIHALDVACWIVDADPIKAYGTGSRTARIDEPGDCSDNFAVIFEFPHNVIVNFTSGQYSLGGYQDIGCRMFGPAGSIDTHYFGEVKVLSKKKPYDGGTVSNMFQSGVENNIATFRRSITEGDYTNPTVEAGVRSNLTTILGRTAAYRRAEVTWDEIMQANEKLVYEKLDALKV